MMTRIQVYLSDEERKALQEIAENEMRGLREQIRFVLHQDLARRGLLAAQDAQKSQSGPAPEGAQDAR